MWAPWLEQQLQGAGANRALPPHTAIRLVRELAEATASVQRGSGNVYGVQLDADRHAQMAPLLPLMSQQLAGWLDVLPGTDVICREAGIAVPAKKAEEALEPRAPEIDAFCNQPGDRSKLEELAAFLIGEGDPIGSHLHRALLLERAPSPELSAAAKAFEQEHREQLVELIWPANMRHFAAEKASFVRGLPVSMLVTEKDIGRFSDAEWARAPLASVHALLLGDETKLAPALALHPVFAKATALVVGFMASPRTDIGPLLARPGAVIEDLHVTWTGRLLHQLARLPHPSRLERLGLSARLEGRITPISGEDITALAALFPSLRCLSTSRLLRIRDEGLAAIEKLGWELAPA